MKIHNIEMDQTWMDGKPIKKKRIRLGNWKRWETTLLLKKLVCLCCEYM